ncbi:esterase/lipase family protein [Kineococcus sp. SYSU DK001]|uniref:esterase/lipase family protein n=1 Tax=Kineococcus sp. SYSU DK001 TaxID=3383122 RepID=UPI003D7C6B5A
MRLSARLADYAWLVRAQLRPGRPDWSGGTAAPVLLVPGIWETWHVLRDLGDALHRAGHPVHVVPGLGTNSADLEVSAGLVRERLLALDLRGVVLVGHSKGGLIAKQVMARPDAGDRVAGLVAVATPFSGSRYATWFPAGPVRRLSPRDPAIRRLAAQTASHARTVALRPRFDPHVPREAGAAPLAGAVEVELPYEGHFRLLGEPGLHEAVVHAVQGLSA